MTNDSIQGVLTRLTVLLVHDPVEDPVPPRGGRHLEEENHAPPESLEIVHFVQRAPQFHCHEEAHAKNGENEHHEEQKKANVEKCRHRHGQGKQQRPYAPCTFHQSQNSPDLGHANHAQQGRGDEVFFYQVTKQYS